jgi:hypothetical protein
LVRFGEAKKDAELSASHPRGLLLADFPNNFGNVFSAGVRMFTLNAFALLFLYLPDTADPNRTR